MTWYSYKNAIKIYEQLGESKFIEFFEYANYLNHHKIAITKEHLEMLSVLFTALMDVDLIALLFMPTILKA